MNSILREMLSSGHSVGEFDFSDDYYLQYEKYFKTGKYKEIIISSEFCFSMTTENINYDTCLPYQWMIVTESMKMDRCYAWPDWTKNINTIVKVTFVFGVKKDGGLKLLHMVSYNIADHPYNAQIDVFASEVTEWSLKGGSVSEVLKLFKYSFGNISMNFDDDMIPYCLSISRTDNSCLFFLESLLRSSVILCFSLFANVDPIVNDIAKQIFGNTLKILQHSIS